jgi:cyclomaltodextrinase / maltogenic alpha-amylase / neopullulanase
MDFIFGTLANDDLKLIHHRVLRRGVQHHHEMEPRDPLPGEPVTITVKVGQDVRADRVSLYFTTDGSAPDGSRGQMADGQVIDLSRIDLVWDTLAWAYIAIWRGELPAQPEGTTVRYRIGAWNSSDDAQDEISADYPEFKATTERAAAAFFRGEPLPDDPPPALAKIDTFAYSVDRFQTPQWAKDAVIYQVFVDRFYPGHGIDWLQPNDLSGFYGGTLWGVRDQLDYIEALGVNCIWLSPTFPSPTHHGYDITDFLHVEPRMGGDDALHTLVEAAHARGIRVLLDLVGNHISHEHPYFVEALNSPSSTYRDWFIFDDADRCRLSTSTPRQHVPGCWRLLNTGCVSSMLMATGWIMPTAPARTSGWIFVGRAVQ